MEIDKYLKRISHNLPIEISLGGFTSLHLQHLYSIPFENLDIHIGRKIVLDFENIYNKIVMNNRGGFCYEMNGLFYSVLTSLGFIVKMVSARVYDGTEPGPEFDHMALIVDLGGTEYLADVGFGDSFREPLKFETGISQNQGSKYYRIESIGENSYILKQSDNGIDFSNMYRFSTTTRELRDFIQMCNYHQTSPLSHFTQKRIITIAKPNGRITISGRKLIETLEGNRTESEIESEEDFNKLLTEHFGVVLE
jgi:N-hydroxyarylamine O-acetyltransferase